MDLDAYCITLDETSKVRALRARENILKLHPRTFSFSPGIDLRSLPPREKEEKLRGLLSYRAYFEIYNGRNVHEALSGMGSVGCFLAHYNLWKKCITKGVPIAIFEDDFALREDTEKIVEKAFEQAKERNYDIFRVCTIRDNDVFDASPIPNTDLIVINRAFGLKGYIITPGAARLMVHYAFPIQMHCDHHIDFVSFAEKLNQYGIADEVCGEDGHSVIGHNTVERYSSFGCPPRKASVTFPIVVIGMLLLLLVYTRFLIG